ncbi:MAG: pyridoxamine 5'-phosphate oxidase family protein [Pseudonocardiales bacterium]|nr:pyridoxamine 5'-phosphate oxidase family protein [Pseudonocardiales bacterium]
MSINATLPQLAETLMRYRFAYLVTMGDDARTHVVPVHATLADDRLRVRGLGQKTQANIAAHPAVTLVWPPIDHSDYSVIVDGVGSIRDEELAVAPTRAVLHRPAQSQASTTGEGCQSDCVELPITAKTARR